MNFVTDIYLPQMLYALTIRSPVAKGTLDSIDCPRLPSAYTLITAKDIPGKNFLEDTSHPVLAHEKLSYIGEPVAILLGPDKNGLEDYSRHCKVIAKEEEPGAADIAAKRDILIGDPETAFAQAASVVRETYSTGIQEHWYAEPSGAVAWLDETTAKMVAVATATQWPFHVRRSVAQVLGLAAARVLVQPGITGLHLDGKLWYPSLIACHAALGAWIAQRPVRLVLTRREDFAFSPKRCATEITVAHALNEKGDITAVEINTTVNLGAHAVNAPEILDHVNLGTLGVYKTNNIRLSSAAVTTNIPPQGPFAGFGMAQGFFAIERQASRIADTIKQDPAQWRFEGIKNAKDPAALQQLITMVVETSDYRRKWAAYELLRQSRGIHLAQEPLSGAGGGRSENLRGIGIALGCQGGGFLNHGADKGIYGIELILEKDGTLEIKTSMPGAGGDYGNLWTDIASEILGINRDMIRISCGTGDSPDSGPQTMSRFIAVLSKLVEQACVAISKKHSHDPLPIIVRKTARPPKDPAWDEYFNFTRPGWASAIVEVEVDPVDYLPRIRGVWLGVDGGKIIQPARARKSVKDSAVQALGWAYREQINYVHGAIPAEQFDNFDIPGPAEIPPIMIDFIKDSHSEPRGIGDLPFSCIPAAYVQAVSQAANHCFRSIPLTARDIWEGITL